MKLTDIKAALAAYQTGNYPNLGDASRTIETLIKALPYLIAIAEAGEIAKQVLSGDVHDDVFPHVPYGVALNHLDAAFRRLEKA